MTFVDWMNMNMAVDLACVVFFVAIVWKFVKLEKKILSLQEDLNLAIKNPVLAKRNLKNREN